LAKLDVTADQQLVKKMNKTVSLNEIIRSYPISRAKLSEVTGLNKSTVSAQIGALLNEELIFEIGQGDSSGGRRPVMLVFNQQAGFTIFDSFRLSKIERRGGHDGFHAVRNKGLV